MLFTPSTKTTIELSQVRRAEKILLRLGLLLL